MNNPRQHMENGNWKMLRTDAGISTIANHTFLQAVLTLVLTFVALVTIVVILVLIGIGLSALFSFIGG